MPSSKPFVDPETLAAVTTAAAANEAAKAEDALMVQRVRDQSDGCHNPRMVCFGSMLPATCCCCACWRCCLH